ncbi:MrpH family fimbial adhesin [Serratia marcescens]|uniref:MrpH family fimbial adhesin n=2 Tax=Serratia TaxID=613 RepID=UPI003FA72112
MADKNKFFISQLLSLLILFFNVFFGFKEVFMRGGYSYFFNLKALWIIKCVLPVFIILFPFNKATASIVWETTYAPIEKDGSIVDANSYKATGVIVSIDFNDPTPNPCYRTHGCNISLGVFHNFSGLATGNGPYREYIGAWSPTGTYWGGGNEEKTMGELYKSLNTKSNSFLVGKTVIGYTSPRYFCDPELYSTGCIITNKWEAYSKVCFILGYDQTGSSTYKYPFPGQSCIGPTPPNNQCNIDAGSVTLDHGQLGTDEVNGNKRKESFRISCTYPANANIALLSNNGNEKIMLKGDNSLYSTVTIDGVPGMTGKKINIPTGGVSIDLESTLHTVGNVEEGPFSGNGILIINAY